jgi:hypothetical protein
MPTDPLDVFAVCGLVLLGIALVEYLGLEIYRTCKMACNEPHSDAVK